MSKQYLGRLFAEAGHVELCWLNDGKMDRGWYASADDLRAELRRGGAIHHWMETGNLFTTLNHLDIEAVREHAEGRPNRRTRNCHVTRYTRLFFDFDPLREKDTASTDQEVAAAEMRAKGLMRRLHLRGWPMPAIGMSGNGYHLQYRFAAPNDAETREQLRAIYLGLRAELSDDEVDFDPVVWNAARLCTLYGSVKRKGPGTAERPHRQSSIWLPPEWRQVSRQQVAALADEMAKRTLNVSSAGKAGGGRSGVRVNGRGDYSTLDVVQWFMDRDHYQFHADGNKHRVLCPWYSEHTNGDESGTIIYEPDNNGTGWPGFYCHHSHCEGRTIRDVIALWGDADNYTTREYQQK